MKKIFSEKIFKQLHKRFMILPKINHKKIIDKFIMKKVKVVLSDKIKNHKMFERTDSNIQGLVNILTEKIKMYNTKLGIICSELNKMRAELKVLETIQIYRKQNHIKIKDMFYYKRRS